MRAGIVVVVGTVVVVVGTVVVLVDVDVEVLVVVEVVVLVVVVVDIVVVVVSAHRYSYLNDFWLKSSLILFQVLSVQYVLSPLLIPLYTIPLPV